MEVAYRHEFAIEYGPSAIEYGRKLGLNGDDDVTKKLSCEFVLKTFTYKIYFSSFPYRNLIYQMRLKLDLSLMEHYERHCPPPERRFNCLIPPPPVLLWSRRGFVVGDGSYTKAKRVHTHKG
uniref:Uncharacterized protein n=1 Tax=Brassica oleracea TaxID=3712 RepID=A0A3P6CHB2_BRAOL|nr:unnamed protein product [Brassica oleracea]